MDGNGGGGGIKDTNPTMSLMDSNVVSENLTNYLIKVTGFA